LEPYGAETAETSPSTEMEARKFFEKKRIFLDTVFGDLFGFTREESRVLQRELRVWFLRLCRRQPNWIRQPRSILFAGACDLARRYRSFKDEVRKDSPELEDRIEAMRFVASLMDIADELAQKRQAELARKGES